MITVPEPSVCPRCGGEGVFGTVTQSWCPDCRCVVCGTAVAAGLGFCRDCDEDDMYARDMRPRRIR